MKNLIFIPAAEVDVSQLGQLVAGMGGRWNGDPTLNQGVIDRDHATIYLSFIERLESEYDKKELDTISRRLGVRPRAGIDIHIGHSPGSEKLAEDVIETLVKTWGGFPDRG